MAGFLISEIPRSSRLLDVGGLLALGALNHVKRDFLTFLEGLEAAHVDRGEMCEQVFAAIVRGNETETLRVVEPLYSTVCHA